MSMNLKPLVLADLPELRRDRLRFAQSILELAIVANTVVDDPSYTDRLLRSAIFVINESLEK